VRIQIQALAFNNNRAIAYNCFRGHLCASAGRTQDRARSEGPQGKYVRRRLFPFRAPAVAVMALVTVMTPAGMMAMRLIE
jgi:hypothetical protein